MIKLRAVFEKTGRAKYISHLDLNRCMLRVFRRSKLPIWFTEGFNPHPYFSFALALSLGFESRCEILDFNLNEAIAFDEVKSRLNEVMPEGMKIAAVYEPQKKITAISEAEYTAELKTAGPGKLKAAIEQLLMQNEILIEKKTKKGIKTVDLKPSVSIEIQSVTENSVVFNIKLPAGTQENYNPMLFIEALKNSCELEFETGNISRIGIYCGNGENFS